ARRKVATLQGRQHFEFDGRQVGLIDAHQVLETGQPAVAGDDLAVIVLGDATNAYGLTVDRFLGECELVVHPLDPQLGKVTDISTGALMEDGSPVLIVDTEDLIQSMDRLVSAGAVSKVVRNGDLSHEKKRTRLLVVDDSLTLR